MNLSIGDFVTWTCPIDVLIKQTPKAKLNPDCLLIIGINENKAQCVLCWYNIQKYMMRIFINKGNVYISANTYLSLPVELLKVVDDIKLLKLSSIDYISKKHDEIFEKDKVKGEEKRQRKIEKAKRKEVAKQNARRRAVERKYEKLRKRLFEPSTDAWKYEMAVMNNDKKAMRSIEKKVGYDPRPKAGCKSGSRLKQVNNPRPCVGGRVSPK